jgi:ABC-type Fe3+-siderophore transport system permease subunit
MSRSKRKEVLTQQGNLFAAILMAIFAAIVYWLANLHSSNMTWQNVFLFGVAASMAAMFFIKYIKLKTSRWSL